MGAKCCMPVKDNVPIILDKKYRASHELYTRRSNKCSPSWSFRVDNRTHIEDIVDDPAWVSHNHSGNVVSEPKSGGDTEIETISDGSSSSDTLQTAKWQKFSSELKYQAGPAGNSAVSHPSCEKSEIIESPNTASSSGSNPSSTPTDPSSSKLCGLRGNRLSKPLSESKILSLDSLNEEGRHSCVISFNSNYLSIEQSHGRSSSDGWSVNSFSELVISSQRHNLTNTQSLQTCGLCSKLVKGPSWQGNEIAVVSVLVCGHVYHAECLESVTPEASKFDPSCPACSRRESSTEKARVKTGWRNRNKVSRRAVADVDVNGNFVLEHQKSGSFVLRARGSKKCVFGWSFIRRHFSVEPRPVRIGSEGERSKKKGFWARLR